MCSLIYIFIFLIHSFSTFLIFFKFLYLYQLVRQERREIMSHNSEITEEKINKIFINKKNDDIKVIPIPIKIKQYEPGYSSDLASTLTTPTINTVTDNTNIETIKKTIIKPNVLIKKIAKIKSSYMHLAYQDHKNDRYSPGYIYICYYTCYNIETCYAILYILYYK